MNKEQALAKIEELKKFVSELEKEETDGIKEWLKSMSLLKTEYKIIDKKTAIVKQGWYVYSWKEVPKPYTRFQVHGLPNGDIRVELLV